jgi:hypothetical protein
MIANISVETPVSSWLTWRAGLTRMFFERYYYTDDNGYAAYGDDWLSNYYSQNGWASLQTGFGINVENWSFDATVSVAGLEALIGDPSFSYLFDGYNNAGGYSNIPLVEIMGFDAKVKI